MTAFSFRTGSEELLQIVLMCAGLRQRNSQFNLVAEISLCLLNEIPAAANILQINIIKKLKTLEECVVYVKIFPVNQFCMSA